MDIGDLEPDPLAELGRQLETARAAGAPLPEAMAVATRGPDGDPALRMVIMRGLDTGLVFYTDRESDKGEDLAAYPRAAALFHWWVPIHRQVRAVGAVSLVSEAESDAYWASRPPGSRRSAIASRQSRVVESREFLVAAVAAAQERYPDETAIVRPERWGGYRITPESVEFWEEGPDRLHDRIRYRRVGEEWVRERLSP